MARSRKSGSGFGIIAEAEARLRDLFWERPQSWVADAKAKISNLPKTNFDLGCRFAEQGLWHDALFRFKVALYFDADYPQARYNLACCYFHIGKKEEAAQEFRKVLKETPDHTDAIFMLGAIDPKSLTPAQRPKQMPRELIGKYFTSIATDYNQTEAAARYRGGVLVAEQVRPLLAPSGLVVVDLACGTGIAAIPYRPLASQMIGVEMTPAMAVQASATGQGDKKLFDQVIEAEIAQIGERIASGSADLVLLVNAAQYIGALEETIATAARLAKPGGLIALTVEPYKGTEPYGIVAETGRFGHQPAYVKNVGAAHALSVEKQVTLALYPEMVSELVLLRKGGV